MQDLLHYKAQGVLLYSLSYPNWCCFPLVFQFKHFESKQHQVQPKTKPQVSHLEGCVCLQRFTKKIKCLFAKIRGFFMYSSFLHHFRIDHFNISEGVFTWAQNTILCLHSTIFIILAIQTCLPSRRDSKRYSHKLFWCCQKFYMYFLNRNAIHLHVLGAFHQKFVNIYFHLLI